MPELDKKDIEGKRNGLIAFIQYGCPQGSLKNNVTIVFDGKPGMRMPRAPMNLKIIFSNSESADDRIKKIVHQAKNKKEIFVVTDDRDIQYSVRSQGAKIIGVKEFLSKKSLIRKKESKLISSKKVTGHVEGQITSEMYDIWIDKKK